MNAAGCNLDGQALAARYEALRQNVVDSVPCRAALRGLALFMRHGMAAWMKSVTEDPVRNAAIPAASSAKCLPEGIERNLIDILANMALTTALESVR